MAQNQAQNQTIQTTERSQWYEIRREISGDVVRLVVKYVDRIDASVYAMRVLEISGDALRVYVRWNMPERRRERLIKAMKLQPEDAERWRNRVMSMASVKDFERLMWEIDEAVLS
jgi:hypothetical protein